MLEGHLVIGYASGGSSRDEFWYSVLQTRLADPKVVGVIGQQGPYVAHNKNDIVRAFLAFPKAPEWLLMIDNDEQFPSWGPSKVMEVARKVGARIVGCNYTQTNYSDGFYRLNKAGSYDSVRELEANRIYRNLDAVAGGFNLVHRSLYEALALKYPPVYPWYWHEPYVVNGELVLPGEDFTFCRRAKECGYQIYGFTGVPIVHHKHQAMLPKYMAPLMPQDSREYLTAIDWR